MTHFITRIAKDAECDRIFSAGEFTSLNSVCQLTAKQVTTRTSMLLFSMCIFLEYFSGYPQHVFLNDQGRDPQNVAVVQ